MQASKPGTQQATYLDKHLSQSWDTSRWRRTSWSSCWHLEIRCAFASCDKIQLRRWGERRHCSKRSWLRHQGGVKLAVSWQFTRLKCDFGGHVMVRTLNTCHNSFIPSKAIAMGSPCWQLYNRNFQNHFNFEGFELSISLLWWWHPQFPDLDPDSCSPDASSRISGRLRSLATSKACNRSSPAICTAPGWNFTCVKDLERTLITSYHKILGSTNSTELLSY